MVSFRCYSLIDLIKIHSNYHFIHCEIKSSNQTLSVITINIFPYQSSRLNGLVAVFMPTLETRRQLNIVDNNDVS